MSPDNRSEPPALPRTRRLARRLCHRARHRLRADRDRIPPSLWLQIREAERTLRQQIRLGASNIQAGQGIDQLQALMAQAFPDRLHAPLRPAWEMFLVAVLIALVARTFFVQPFSVPTGSMEPALAGITSRDLREDPDFVMPSWSQRIWARLIHGTRYFELTARSDGFLEEVHEPARAHPFAQYRFRIGSAWYRVPAALEPFLERFGIEPEHYYQAGDPILRFSFTHGDFLLADRVSYNFRRPRRAEIVVFETRDSDAIEADQYFVKRLVALDGDHVRIGNDRHLIVNGQRIDASTPGFRSIYSAREGLPDDNYIGHLNGVVAAKVGLRWPEELAPLFPDEDATFLVRQNHFLVLGDNSLFSLDSRAWGDLPLNLVMGRAWAIYWPFSPRWGWIDR
jgi:signal peptidase I